jgi:hypothetical protein
MQRDRRHNPYPWTWEIPVGVVCAVLLVLALGVHLGNSLAHLTSGQGWTWPASSQLFASLPTVLTNSTGAVGVHTWIIAVEFLLLGGLTSAAVAGWQRWGPSRLKGVATRDQAEQVLGVTRLHKVARIVRPDIHPTRPTRRGPR